MKRADRRRRGKCRSAGGAASPRRTHIAAGFLLVFIQGPMMAVRAADLPQVLTGINARFSGAQLPVVTGNTMVIEQVADKATLHWQSFDIGAGHGVEFHQPSASAVAINRIFDGTPSEIRGRLTANGQVYLINSNGIVFGDGAQVNTQSLVASTLDIDDQVYEQIGFVNAINDSSGVLPAFDSLGRPMGEIHLEPGATLDAASGGRILIFAPKITNEGTIRTPEGQQVLAAATDKVLIAASDDQNLRGLLVEVSTGGEVENLGAMIAERGNVSLIGMAVNQNGLVRATTSVALNGSIHLRAQDMNGTLNLLNDEQRPFRPEAVRGGAVTLGGSSITEVVPDASSAADGSPLLANDAQSQPRSGIEILGTRVHLQSGARVTATGGDITLRAALDPNHPRLDQPGDPESEAAELIIEPGAVVDASGDDTTEVSVTRNVVTVEARGNELADSPVQRDGPIRNQKLQVDIRQGTEFLDISGAVAAISRSAAERQSAGGSITALSEGALVLGENARLDVSGGRVTYTEGVVATSSLRQTNGQVVGISRADPGQTYTGVVDTIVRREAGYVEGKDAGQLTVQARDLSLQGVLAAGITSGMHQRRAPATLDATTLVIARPFDQMPRAGVLALSLLRSGLPDLVIGRPLQQSTGTTPPWVVSAAMLAASGAGVISFNNAGAVLVDEAIELPAWTSLTLDGTRIAVAADVRIPGGTLQLRSGRTVDGNGFLDGDLLTRIDGVLDLSGTWVNDDPRFGTPSAPIVMDGGSIEIRSGSSIEVSAASRLDVSAGGWRETGGTFNGGRGGSIALATGRLQTVQAGTRLEIGGELRGFGFATGGALVLDAERIRIVPQPGSNDDDDLLLLGQRQFGLSEVGDVQGQRQYFLEVGAGTFQQGGFGSYALQSSRADLAIENGAEVRLRTAALTLADAGSAVAPGGTPLSSLTVPRFLPQYLRSPAELVLTAMDKLGNAIGRVADLTLAAGARIFADPGSTVDLRSSTSLFVDGVIDAPAGRIDLSIGNLTEQESKPFVPSQMIRLGSTAALRAGGVVQVDTSDPRGLRRGEVLDGGIISLRADQGSIVAAAGAALGVDGVTGELDIGAGMPTRSPVAGAAGAIELIAAESLLWQGSLSAAAPAGSSAEGGRLTVRLDPGNRNVLPLIGVDGIPRGPHTLVMQDFAGTIPMAGAAVDPQYHATGFVPISAVRAGGFASLDVIARSSAVARGTPDTPQSLPVIAFPADLDLELARSIRLDAAVLATDHALVSLSAPYVGLGYDDPRLRFEGTVPSRTSATNPQITTTPIRLTPTAGTGRLEVAAGFVDLVGELVTRGFGDAATGRTGLVLRAKEDLRLRGVRPTLQEDYRGLLRTAGNLLIEASRIYPSTLSEFELAVEGGTGRIELAGGGGSAVPLAVGGSLTLRAADIVQGGALFAPLGTLDFRATSSLSFAPASLSSTTAVGVSAPFFRTEPGGSLILPAPTLFAGTVENQVSFVDAVNNAEIERLLPQQRIHLAAPAVTLDEGSRFDLRGGSDVAATEFVPGPGGSRDILLADLAKGAAVEPNASFAILPGVSGFAPHDPLESPEAEAVQGLRIGDTLLIEEALPGLPAGEYAILPARYALFGGYLVTPAGQQDLRPGAGLMRPDGTPILAGRYAVAGSGMADARSQGFVVEDGTRVRRRAEYLQTALDGFYTGAARSPLDAGALVIEAADSLVLRGELVQAANAPGRGSAVDIATQAALRVVGELSGGSGMELRASDLGRLGTDSLLLGGMRSHADDGEHIVASGGSITIEPGVLLDLPELLLVGDRIEVRATPAASTRLGSSGETAGAADIALDGDAAVLALSNRRLNVLRAAATVSDPSSLIIEAGVTLATRGSLVVDASGDVAVSGDLAASGAQLSLGAGLISIGQTTGHTIPGGLILSNEDLAAIAGSDLRLASRGFIDVYGRIGQPDAIDQPLYFDVLTLDAQGLRGRSNAGVISTLAAGEIELANSTGAGAAGPALPAAEGSELRLHAAELLELGEGTVALQGFDATSLMAGDALMLEGDGGLQVSGDLGIDAPIITAGRAVSSAVGVAGRVFVTAAEATDSVAAVGLGAALAIDAQEIDFGGRIVLPSGTVRFTGDDIDLVDAAVIDVSGANLVFGPQQVGTPGGTISLTARTGDVAVGAATRLDVSGADVDPEAGELSLSAQAGAVRLERGTQWLGTDRQGLSGRFLLDAQTLAADAAVAEDAVGALLGLLGDGGFHDTVSLRLRGQAIPVAAGTMIEASHIRLVADTGDIDMAGTLDASGAAAGDIWLAAGDRLDVSGVLRARSTAEDGRGGRVDLYALDADGDDAPGTADVVHLHVGSLVDVSGELGGEVFVHTRRLDDNADQQTDRLLSGDLAGSIVGAARAGLVATRVVRDPGAVQVIDPATGGPVGRVTVTSGLIRSWRDETQRFLDTRARSIGPLELLPGLLVESSGDLVLRDTWDFADGWSFAPDPGNPPAASAGRSGVLTLRAARNLDLQADLTDAFRMQWLFGAVPFDGLASADERMGSAGASAASSLPHAWGYRLAAGADPGSADVLATAAVRGSLQLGSGVRVRTGSADIDIAASADVWLRDDAAIYSAGVDSGLSAHLDEVLAPAVTASGLTAYDVFGTFLNGGQFPDFGGSVSIAAGGDLRVDTAPGPVSAWLTRVGSGVISAATLYSDTEGFGAIPTHWAVVFDAFRNGVGAFGGGDLRLALGGDVSNALLATPVTGRVAAGVEAIASELQLLFLPSARTTGILGGGQVDLTAAGDFTGGQLVVGQGSAHVRTGGATGAEGAPQLYLGADSGIDWLAARSLVVAGLQDPTVTPLSASQLNTMLQIGFSTNETKDIDNRFYTYTDATRVRLAALGGDLSLGAAGAGPSGYLPPGFSAIAFGGSLRLESSPIEFFPSATGQLELLARDDVIGNFVERARLSQSDADRGFLASVDRPDLLVDAAPRARTPVQGGDPRSNLVVARDGSVLSRPGVSGYWSLEFAKPTIIEAGTDISNLLVRIQHMTDTDQSSLVAGRDIVQGVLRGNDGRFEVRDSRIFEIWGPGSTEFIAGRSILLGTSAGIESIGNVKNPALPDQGASLRLLAGAGSEPDWDRFIDVYLSSARSDARDAINAWLSAVDAGRAGFQTSSGHTGLSILPGEHADELEEFLAAREIPLLDDDPVRTLRALDRRVQRELLTGILFAEIREWGSATVTGDRADVLNFVRSYVALDTLFRTGDAVTADPYTAALVRAFLVAPPAAVEQVQKDLFGRLFPALPHQGDVSLLLSQVQTLAGGSISMLAPRGDINAGVAAADVINKKPEELGVVTGRDGDIHIAVDGDLLVNSTRVTALRGDVLAWSSNGNIDAGRGSKTVTSVPDPIATIDADGNTVVVFPPAIAGSGVNGVNAALFAPRGEVNAGDAGIQTSGNLIIGAVEVVGADNIAVGGAEIGFSSSEVAAVAPPGASSASSAATRGISSQESLLAGEDDAGDAAASAAPLTFISVEVLGFGGDDEDEG